LSVGNGIIGRIASQALVYFGWEYDSRGNWNQIQGKKFAIYHENDGIISAGARFHEGLNEADFYKMSRSNYKPSKEGEVWTSDNPTLIDAEIKRCTKDNTKILEQMKSNVDRIAHMRNYNEEEAQFYFEKITMI
jgi:hypothetical protein